MLRGVTRGDDREAELVGTKVMDVLLTAWVHFIDRKRDHHITVCVVKSRRH